ncbi:uncharacterized protein LOC105202133 isoform X2 [Solenopsis invicta]|uniref:uncharacterized protein LOC105202133 isoform X2 n=1 Tax=Solenopsis invicta TaxID=13686 RepID=UPI0005963AE1|nr:uncharacterized protein LOC105202133 isoform X2 [Solenopsis invicta]
MAMASSSKTTIDETPQENYIWMELRLLQSIVVQSRLGQTVLKLVDNFLWTAEKCMEWSLPRHEVGEDENRKDSGKPCLVRPLPWLLFLPSLVMLRVIKVTMNVGAFILGYSQITSSGMIRFVQISRRYLNAAMNKGKEKHEIKVTTSEEKSVDSTTKVKDSTSEAEKEEKKEETLNEKLDRLALENSEDDEDFDPAKCSLSDTSDDDDDENSDDGNVSPTEVLDIIEDTKAFQKSLNHIEQFLKAEQQTSTLTTHQELVEPVCGKRSSAKESRDKVEERFATSRRIESPECYTPDRSSQEGEPTFYSPISSDSDAPKECSMSSVSVAEQRIPRKILKTNVNGEARFISSSTSTISESKSSGQINNGAVMEKRSTNVSKYHKGKRMSHGNRKKK